MGVRSGLVKVSRPRWRGRTLCDILLVDGARPRGPWSCQLGNVPKEKSDEQDRHGCRHVSRGGHISFRAAVTRSHRRSRQSSCQPIAGVRVSVVDGANVEIAAETEADGFFAIERIEPGSYTLLIEHPGYAPVR